MSITAVMITNAALNILLDLANSMASIAAKNPADIKAIRINLILFILFSYCSFFAEAVINCPRHSNLPIRLYHKTDCM